MVSYLTHRRQRVRVGDAFSEWQAIPAGVPQGSVLGPLLFLIYTIDLPSACTNSNTFCDSVGHVASCTGPPSGKGNPFGKAFHTIGGIWNETICMADSDGDGVANGAELGDPNCTFIQGSTPLITTGISHPGFACSTAADPFCLSSPVSQFMTAPTGGSGATTGAATTGPATTTSSGQAMVANIAMVLLGAVVALVM
ncbi:temptin-like [Sycon ciliatum]|uniref:temptin-like n=1 Tax=Sycon ciliatum TaxID=27933 RepID=UPI0031F67103